MFNERRRKLVQLFGSVAATWPLEAGAQRSKVAQIVGALYLGVADGESFTKELLEGMRQLGYVEGQNLAFAFRSAQGRPERLPELAAELVGLKVDVIVALYVPCALAAKQATREIPIVILAGDPIETGIVPSLARPGGNITGLSLMAAASNGKSVELFRDILPSIQRVGVLGHATNPVYAKAMLDEVLLAGGQTRIKIQPVVMVRGPEDLEIAFATLAKDGAGARRPRQLVDQTCGRSGNQVPVAGSLDTARLCGYWWVDVIWCGRADLSSPSCQVRTRNSPRDTTERHAYRTADEV